MCYSNIVFNQNIKTTVNREEIERERINDRGKYTASIVGYQTRFQTAGNLIFKP